MRRKCTDSLIYWKKNPGRKPLILQGLRQTGKTWLLMDFGNKQYEHTLYINLETDRSAADYLSVPHDPQEVLLFLETCAGKPLRPASSLLILDNIQCIPQISTLLTSIALDFPQYHIASIYKGVVNSDSFSVHDFDILTLYPLDFEEFLWAKGYSEKHIGDILKHMQTGIPFSETELSVYKKLFLEYCVLGGMPAVVKVYIERNLFTDTLEIQRQIQMDYEEDIRKYAEGLDQTKIVSVYRNVPVQLAKENKKFQLSKIDKKARSREYMGCITWLEDAGVISVCYCLQYPELPLKGNYDDSKFKIYYPDTGLLIASLDEEAQEDLRANKNLGVYKGALYENFVAEAFVKQGLGLYYYKKENATLEEDFFVRTKDELVPVEVKANRNRSKSLRQLISGDSYGDIHWGIKLADSNVGIEDGIYTFPYFCTFLLKRYLRGK